MWPIFQGRTCMPSNSTSGKQCSIGGYPEYAINVTNVAQIQLAVNFARLANVRLVIKNTGHCYLGKSSGAGALSLWMHNMRDIDFLPDYEGPGYSGPALKLAAGVTVREVYEAADRNNVTVTGAVSWSVGYAGGMITGGGQNPLAGIYGMAADHVVAFNVVTADGVFRTISEVSEPDLFWALRGGGGGTFAVTVSVIIRAHPKLNVVTAGWRLDATLNSLDAFWAGTKKFYDVFLDWADSGIYSFFIMGNSPAPFLDMRYLFAPNHTMESYTETVKPFYDYLKARNITLASPHKSTAHDTFYSAYQATWGSNSFPMGLDNSLPANRIVPRFNFKEKYDETFALIKEHVSSGKHFLGYHKAPVKYGNVDNAVNPAWRKCAMFLVTSPNKSLDHSTPEGLTLANKDLQENILQPWRDISPVSQGGGTYLNEASIMEPDWQESFYGGYYERLSKIKEKWDPEDVFYATTAVGTEESEEGWANSSAPFRPAKSQVCTNEKGESVGNGLFANVDFEPAAWNRGHKYQCKILKKLGDREIPKAVLACMDLLTMKKQDIVPEQAWNMLLSLPSHIEDFKANGNYGNIELMAMGASQFSLTQDLFDKDFVAAMYARASIIVDPMLGHFNHSCDPNAYIIMDGAEVHVRSLKPIKKDEEIFISYIDTTNPYYRRQHELKQRWFFTCKCTKCQKGATLDEDKWAIDPKDLPQEMQQVAEMMTKSENFASDPANFAGNSKIEKCIATIQGKAFAEYEAAQRAPPEQANEIIVNGMRLCHQSGLWPVYRQPYAALRDELIVSLLTTGTYSVAWAQCAKRFKHVQPKLYPVHFHPVRVVQTWQMAMLAAYFAGEEEGIGAPGANMGLIAMMLTKQVLDAAMLSHGPNSSFTQSVQSKANEMSEALKRSVGDNPDTAVINKELEQQKAILMEMGDWIQY
ncbi:hypothetical protein E8E13_004580 [Curvularia kusanoi]|uniref:FAD-binding PCMH-type domain-containing protein n=1 Tax=Curvularia kusanoi TaxID=90978 RepID=A0A9P4W7T2_CURKU|nr:hypothetical protein E8E13_004580 [Curvularia kusanoi]